MIQTIKGIYKSPDLYGDILTIPLKSYHSFFASKIEKSSNLGKLAWTVAAVATSLFCYHILATLALVGFLIKSIGAPFLVYHNISYISKMLDFDRTLSDGMEGMNGGINDGKMLDQRRIYAEIIHDGDVRDGFKRVEKIIGQANRDMRKIVQVQRMVGNDKNMQGTLIYQLILAEPST